MIRLPVFRSASEHSTLYPARKLSPDGRTTLTYFAQARESSVVDIARRAEKGLKLSEPLVFVPVPSPVAIGTAHGDELPCELVGYLTDDPAGLTREVNQSAAAATAPAAETPKRPRA